MKKTLTAVLALVCALLLCACGCKHETWIEADCVTPKTCESCGETEGAPLGHTWAAATCETAKTCETCGAVEGEALGHKWVDATCEEAKTCEACGLTEGEALGHQWQEATTEAPKTCATCSATEGERIITDLRFTTANCAPLFGKWIAQREMTGADLDPALAPYADVLPVNFICEFHNDGTMSMHAAPADMDQIAQIMQDYTVDLMYQEFANMGLSEADANAAMLQTYGKNVEDYVAAEVAKMDFNELFSAFAMDYVYYVEGDLMYLGFSWDGILESDTYTLDGDTLYLPLEGEEPVAFTRVTE